MHSNRIGKGQTINAGEGIGIVNRRISIVSRRIGIVSQRIGIVSRRISIARYYLS
ncbi:MAG: hypothetical protein V7L29_07810 [Nostoc sp.]